MLGQRHPSWSVECDRSQLEQPVRSDVRGGPSRDSGPSNPESIGSPQGHTTQLAQTTWCRSYLNRNYVTEVADQFGDISRVAEIAWARPPHHADVPPVVGNILGSALSEIARRRSRLGLTGQRQIGQVAGETRYRPSPTQADESHPHPPSTSHRPLQGDNRSELLPEFRHASASAGCGQWCSGSATTVTKKSSIFLIASMNWIRSTGLVT